MPEPAQDDPQIALFRQGKDALKAHLIAAAKTAGEKVTPAQIDKQIMVVERNEAALRAIEAVEAADALRTQRWSGVHSLTSRASNRTSGPMSAA